jgi:hypothetical protein
MITRAFFRAALVMGVSTAHATLIYVLAVLRGTVLG